MATRKDDKGTSSLSGFRPFWEKLKRDTAFQNVTFVQVDPPGNRLRDPSIPPRLPNRAVNRLAFRPPLFRRDLGEVRRAEGAVFGGSDRGQRWGE